MTPLIAAKTELRRQVERDVLAYNAQRAAVAALTTSDEHYHCFGCDTPRDEMIAFCPSCNEATEGWSWSVPDTSELAAKVRDTVIDGLLANAEAALAAHPARRAA